LQHYWHYLYQVWWVLNLATHCLFFVQLNGKPCPVTPAEAVEVVSKENGVRLLLKCLKSYNLKVKRRVLFALVHVLTTGTSVNLLTSPSIIQQLFIFQAENRNLLVKEGGIEQIVLLLDSAWKNHNAKLRACHILGLICKDSRTCLPLILHTRISFE